MKNFRNFTSLLATFLLLSSCGDNPDKLMKEQISWMKDVTKVLNKVADGNLSPAQAAEKIDQLGRAADKIKKRQAVLFEDLSPEESYAIMHEYTGETSEAMQKFMEAMQKVVSSGRMTKKLSEAIEKTQQR